MRCETVLKGLRAGCGALALVLIGAAGCSESGGDRVGSGPAERPPGASPSASSPTAPSGSASAPSTPPSAPEAVKPEPGSSGATSGTDGSASPAPSATPPASAESGQAAKPDAGQAQPGSGDAATQKGDAATQKTAAASGQDASRVMAVQQALKDEGHDPGPIDGLMGPRTRQALRAFQTAEGLPETGRTDTATLDALGVDGGG